MNPRTTNLPLRAIAARALARVLAGQGSLQDVLPAADQALTDRRDRAQLRVILYASLRSIYRRQAALALLMEKPLQARAAPVEALLLIGLTELEEGIDAAYAVVDASVDAARALGWGALSGLVNAVLRNALRQGAALYQRLPDSESLRCNHPDWLIERLHTDWPSEAAAILLANNCAAPLWLRVNRRRCGRDQLRARLSAAGIEATAHPQLANAVQVPVAGAVTDLPGWNEGWISVQDASAQLAVELLELQPGLRVLDACAAPGGKLAHIAEREPELARLLGVDFDGKRLERTRQGMRRLGLQPTLKQGDATQPETWCQGERFDRILIDAPCSGTGVIRRHPDIRLLRRASDIATLCQQQARLLDHLWPLLAAGARLVYATCSVLKDENENQIAAFVARTADARVAAVLPSWFGSDRRWGRQNFPGQGDADGFFYAVLERHSG